MDLNIRIFKNKEFGAIRTMKDERGEPLFCLRDVCEVLELRTQKVVQRLEDDVLSKYPIVDSLGRTQQATFVNEDGLYSPSLYDQQVEVLNVTSSDDAVKYRLVYSRGWGDDVAKRDTTTVSGNQKDGIRQRVGALLPYPLMLNEGALGIQKWTTP